METTQGQVFIQGNEVPSKQVGEGIKRALLGFDTDLMMTHVTFEKGAVSPTHRHPHRQVTYVERGAFEVTIGDSKKVLKAGDSFFIPPDIDHGATALEEGSLVDVFTPYRADFLNTNG